MPKAKVVAGRELDALVAEKVTGKGKKFWPIICYAYAHKLDGNWCIECEKDVFNAEQVPPPYSSSIAAAWEVVSEMRKRDFYVEVGQYREQWGCSFRKDTPTMNMAQHGYADADTAPLAICLAALKAVQP